jgi:hypothetical protein
MIGLPLAVTPEDLGEAAGIAVLGLGDGQAGAREAAYRRGPGRRRRWGAPGRGRSRHDG